MMRNQADYHAHTWLCGHAVGEAEEYVQAALHAGLEEIGFAEHLPMYWLPSAERDPEIAMPMEALEGYVRTVLDLRARYPEIEVKLGVEADYIPGFERELEELLSPFPWDYVYGSVHYLDGWGFDNPAQAHRYDAWELGSLYEAYFGLVCDAARTDLFDVLGHVDVIKKWGHEPTESAVELYHRVAAEIVAQGLVVEANTAGYRKPVGKMYPSGPLLQELARQGASFCLGSDAHAPDEVGAGFTDAAEELQRAGVESLVRFKGRQRRAVPINTGRVIPVPAEGGGDDARPTVP